MHLRAHDDTASSGGISLANALISKYHPSGREIGTLDILHQFVQGDILRLAIPVHQVGHRVRDLTQIVGRNVGRHPHCDAADTVHQKVGQPRRQHEWFLERAIKVVAHIDSIFVQVGEHLVTHSAQPRLGISHGSRTVAIYRPKVALTVHERIAHREILRHTHHGFIYGRVAVRMVLAEYLSHDTGALARGPVVMQPHVIHRIQNATLHGLEAIAHIGQGARRNHTHGIAEVGRAHRLFYIGLFVGDFLH